ncbi:MAG: hypothetical protein WA639_12715, partial [Candidatus Acidiferrum sp.]
PLHYATVNETVLFLLRKLGLRAGPGQPGPRLHDLRHTFASRAWGEPLCCDSLELAHMQFNDFSFSNFLFSFRMTLGW